MTSLIYFFLFFSVGCVSYRDVLKAIGEKWVVAETKHKVSKSASEEFWGIASSMFDTLFESKKNNAITNKVPKFATLRQKLYNDNVPPVHLSTAYRHRETGEITYVDDVTSTPVSQFSPRDYEQLYEFARVKVHTHTYFFLMYFFSVFYF